MSDAMADDANPTSLSDRDLDGLAKRIATALSRKAWQGEVEPTYNDGGDRVVIELEFVEGRDLTPFAVMFHKVDGLWKLRGFDEVMHATLAMPVEPAAPPRSDAGYDRPKPKAAQIRL
jgi:hypothetical protein